MSKYLDEVGAQHIVDLTKEEFTNYYDKNDIDGELSNYYDKDEVDELIENIDIDLQKQITIPTETDALDGYTQITPTSALPILLTYAGGTKLYVDYGADYVSVWGDLADDPYDSNTIMVGKKNGGIFNISDYGTCDGAKYVVLEDTVAGTIEDYIVFGLSGEVNRISGGESVACTVIDQQYSQYSTATPEYGGKGFIHYSYDVSRISGNVDIVGGSGDVIGACQYAPGNPNGEFVATGRRTTKDVSNYTMLHVYQVPVSGLPVTVPKVFVSALVPNSFEIWTTNMDGTDWTSKYRVNVPTNNMYSPFSYKNYVRYSSEALYEDRVLTVPKYVETNVINTVESGSDKSEFFTGTYNEDGKPIYGRYFYFKPWTQEDLDYYKTRPAGERPFYHTITHGINIDKVYGVQPTWRATGLISVYSDEDASEIRNKVISGNGFGYEGAATKKNAYDVQVNFLGSSNSISYSGLDDYYMCAMADRNVVKIYKGMKVDFYDCTVLLTYTKRAT